MCIALCLTALPTGAAAKNATAAESVLTMVRPRIPDTSGYDDFTSSVSIENDRTAFHFNWSSTENGIYKGMYITALESGIITSFGISEGKPSPGNNNAPSGFDRISLAEAQSRTKNLLKVLNPDIADKLTLKPLSSTEQFDAQNHTFSITHTESGIPVYGDHGRVTVDINAEKITGFSLTYTDGLAYPSPVKIIDLATAKSVFAEEIGLDLYYKVWQDNETKTLKVFPVYSPKTDNYYINANTGSAEKIVPFSEKVFIKNEVADSTAGSGASLGLTPAELKEIENLKKLLPRKSAEELVRKTALLGIGDDYTMEEFTTRRLSSIQELYGHSLVFCRTEDERSSYIFVDINAETGEVLSYSNFTPNKGEVTNENIDAAALCDDILKTLAPKKHSEYKLRNNTDDTRYVVYDRFANGIRVDGNTISIELDPSGALASYRISYTDTHFPMYSDILSNQLAARHLFDTAGYTLVYIPQKSNDSLKFPDKAVLIYDLSDYSICLDPYTGKRINTDGTEYIAKTNEGEYTDISGHYAEDRIKSLRRFGIGFESAEFMPDAACLQKDFITLIVGAFGTKNSILIAENTNHTDYYSEAEALEIIKAEEISPDSPVSRIEAAKFICRALKIEKYAQLDKIYSCPFNDVKTQQGYVTLLWGMGIINGTSAKTFSPQDSLSRGQAAIIIYNAMNTL